MAPQKPISVVLGGCQSTRLKDLMSLDPSDIYDSFIVGVNQHSLIYRPDAIVYHDPCVSRILDSSGYTGLRVSQLPDADHHWYYVGLRVWSFLSAIEFCRRVVGSNRTILCGFCQDRGIESELQTIDAMRYPHPEVVEVVSGPWVDVFKSYKYD